MTKRRRRRHGRRGFRNILRSVASENAVRLMGRARIANRVAKSLHGESRVRAYAVKTQALLRLTSRFPERVWVVNDFNTPRFVLVKVPIFRFGLHAPSYMFGTGETSERLLAQSGSEGSRRVR
jgi:hypothetical protein